MILENKKIKAHIHSYMLTHTPYTHSRLSYAILSHTPYELTPILTHVITYAHTHTQRFIHTHTHTMYWHTLTTCSPYPFIHIHTHRHSHTSTHCHMHPPTHSGAEVCAEPYPSPPRLEASASTSQIESFTPTNRSTRCFYPKRT